MGTKCSQIIVTNSCERATNSLELCFVNESVV